jgi:ribosomal-protein-alanine N-acetyltransferase
MCSVPCAREAAPVTALLVPSLTRGKVTIRGVTKKDARELEFQLLENRGWLRKWEATTPGGFVSLDTRAGIRHLLSHAKAGTALPFIIEYEGKLAGQLNVSGLVQGSLSTAQLGYWVTERVAGKGVTPTAVALATDYCFSALGLHRMEICIRPENAASLRVVEKLGFRYEGLRRRYIHISGDWRDHFCFALVSEEVREGVLNRWVNAAVPAGVGSVPAADMALAQTPFAVNTPRP